MCGIVALLGAHPGEAAQRVKRALHALRHRGPDGEGTWSGPHCALGHVRLATLAPENGAQPVANEDGSVRAVVSGEFYGYRALRQSLEARGHRFRTDSDSELLVHLFEEHGDALTEHLNGEYAFVLWDARRARLMAGRDPFGVRPLLFAETADGLAFASEAKALFALGHRPAWDEDMLALALSLQYPLPGRTLFEGAHELQPGELVCIERGRWSRRASTPFPATDQDLAPEEAAHETLNALRRATVRRLRGSAPVCTQLSGGLDSTAIAALAQEASAAPLAAYTVRFMGGGEHDEGTRAAESASALGLDHRIVELDTDALLEALPQAVAHGEGLAINHHIAAKFVLARTMREHGFSVALTGEGADEVFLGYAHLAADAEGCDAAQLARANRASAGLMLPSGAGLDLAPIQSVLGFVPTWLRSKASLGARVWQLLSPEALQAVRSSAPVERAAAALGAMDFAQPSAPERSAESWSRLALASYILKTLGDGMELAHAVEGRLPFLDPEVVRCAARTPVDTKLAGGTPKALLREALRGVVPEEVRTRTKHPFLAPTPGGAEYAAFLEAQLERDAFGPAGRFDAERVRRQMRAACAADEEQRTAWGPPLLAVLSASWLSDRYGLD